MRLRPLVLLCAGAAAAAGLVARRRSGSSDPYDRKAIEEYPTPPLVQRPAPGSATPAPDRPAAGA